MEPQQQDEQIPPIELVGQEFLKQYYLRASSVETSELHKFYRKNAVCCIGDSAAVTGSAKIKEKLSVAFKNATFNLAAPGSFCSFQPTPDNGALVMVSGLVTLPELAEAKKGPTRFVHTFLLGREADKQHISFSISNDILRFVEPTPEVAAPAPVARAQQQPAPQQVSNGATAHASAGEPTSETPSEPVVEKKNPPAAKDSHPPKQQNRSNQPRSQPAPQPQAPPPPAEPQPKTPPSSYAQAAAGGSSSSSTPKDKDAAVAAPQRAPEPPAGFSVFVKSSDNTKKLTESMLAESFKVFGVVTKVTINVPKATAVVTFVEQKEAEAALKAKELVCDGLKVVIEVHKNKPTSNKSNKANTGNNGSTVAGSNVESKTRTSGAPRVRTGNRPPQQQGGAGNGASSNSQQSGKVRNKGRGGGGPKQAPQQPESATTE